MKNYMRGKSLLAGVGLTFASAIGLGPASADIIRVTVDGFVAPYFGAYSSAPVTVVYMFDTTLGRMTSTPQINKLCGPFLDVDIHRLY
jgi:hypothetical protein